MKPVIWQGCYDEGWKGVIVPEAFAHPAKFSRGLIKRILDHMLARGYIAKGDTIGDPFGGIGTGGIEAAYRGLRWMGVELEEKFVGLAKKNFELHRGKWDTLGLPRPVILRGDSRRFDVAVQGVVTSPPFTQDQPCASQAQLRGNIQGRAKRDQQMVSDRNIQALREGELSAVVSSPPYNKTFSQEHSGKRGGKRGGKRAVTSSESTAFVNYGVTGGQIEGSANGDLNAVISSPPYSDISAGAGGLNTKPAKKAGQQSGRKNGASQDTDQRYGDDPAQIAKLRDKGVEAVITSPPYADTPLTKDRNFKSVGQPNRPEARGADRSGYRYHADAVVTSPPYEGLGQNPGSDLHPERTNGRFDHKGTLREGYGESPQQIGREAGEAYWQAMLQVYSACYRSIKPGGYIAVVVKDYVKNKARVPLCDDSLRLLCHVGFTPIERIHAMLVEETTHAALFGGDQVVRKERKSFFRRLAEKKGSPRIDYEEVLICRRPE